MGNLCYTSPIFIIFAANFLIKIIKIKAKKIKSLKSHYFLSERSVVEELDFGIIPTGGFSLPIFLFQLCYICHISLPY